MKTYYETLGLAQSATPAEIEHAYRTFTQGPGPAANLRDQTWAMLQAEVMREAYETLIDAARRAQYDTRLGAVTEAWTPWYEAACFNTPSTSAGQPRKARALPTLMPRRAGALR